MRWRALCSAVLVVLAASAFAEPPSPDPAAGSAQPQESPAAGAASKLPVVTVQAQREAIHKQAQTFVRKVSGSAFMADSGEHMLGMWRRPVCPLVAGLARPAGQFIFDRLGEVMTEAGVRQGVAGCKPNLLILVTTQPEALLKAWKKRDVRMFAHSMPAVVRRLFDDRLPVRFWYTTQLTAEGGEIGSPGTASLATGLGSSMAGGMDGGAVGASAQANLLGDIPTFQSGAGGRLGSRLGLGAVHDLAAVIAIVDFSRMEGTGWGQLADYIAMSTLTNVDPYANFSDTPSILALFSTTAEARPKGLTAWDIAYLKALYHTDRMSPLQRVQISEQIARELDPEKARTAGR